MTKEQLSFMFNREIDGFFIEPDVNVGREKHHGKKRYYVLDMRGDDTVETQFKTIDELWEFKLNGERLGDLIEKLTELNIDGEFEPDPRGERGVDYNNITKGDYLFR